LHTPSLLLVGCHFIYEWNHVSEVPWRSFCTCRSLQFRDKLLAHLHCCSQIQIALPLGTCMSARSGRLHQIWWTESRLRIDRKEEPTTRTRDGVRGTRQAILMHIGLLLANCSAEVQRWEQSTLNCTNKLRGQMNWADAEHFPCFVPGYDHRLPLPLPLRTPKTTIPPSHALHSQSLSAAAALNTPHPPPLAALRPESPPFFPCCSAPCLGLFVG
jgi:hypothetical protein